MKKLAKRAANHVVAIVVGLFVASLWPSDRTRVPCADCANRTHYRGVTPCRTCGGKG